jgi:hypothetical protein
MNPSSSQFPTSNVKVVKPLSNDSVPDIKYNLEDKESQPEWDSRSNGGGVHTSESVRREENDAGKEVFYGFAVRRTAKGKNSTHTWPAADAGGQGYDGAYSTSANSARSRAFNRAETARLESTKPENVKKSMKQSADTIKEIESNPKMNKYVKERKVIKIDSGKAK